MTVCRRTLFCLTLLLSTAACAQKTREPEEKSWLQPGAVVDAEGLVMTRPGFPNRPHVLLVNTAKAVSDETLFEMLCAIRKETLARVWTNTAPASLLARALTDPDALHRVYGTNAVLTVLIERAPDAHPLIVAPRHWVRLNLAGIDTDKPAPDALKTRLNRAALRAVAFGAGAGATSQPHCLMWCGVEHWTDMAKTGPNFSPECAMSIMHFLRTRSASAGLIQLWKLGSDPDAEN